MYFHTNPRCVWHISDWDHEFSALQQSTACHVDCLKKIDKAQEVEMLLMTELVCDGTEERFV